MAMTYGMALMGKHKRKDLEDIQAEARKQQKRAQKKGLWSSLGGTLGSLAVPLMFGTGIGAPAALALKMGMGYAGRRAGEALAPDVSRKAVKEAGDYGFHGDIAEDYASGLKEAQENLNRQQFMTSIVNPLQEYGIGEASKMAGKWAGETGLGQKYNKFVDEGGLFGSPTDATTGVDIGSLRDSGMNIGQYRDLVKSRQAGYQDSDDDWDYNDEIEAYLGPYAPGQGG